MNDNDAKETIFRPRASNTTATLEPREVSVMPLNGPGLGPQYADFVGIAKQVKAQDGSVPIQKTDLFTKREHPTNLNKPGQIISTDSPKKFSVLNPPSLESRVKKLEEQMDSLLDRIAIHNTKSSHKI